MIPKDEYNIELCHLKHSQIEKDINALKDSYEEKHQELLKIIEKFKEETNGDCEEKYENLKNKIIVTDQSIHKKIDELYDFNKKIKGNGDPGLFEQVRNLENKFKWYISIIIVSIALLYGGRFMGVSYDTIKEKITGKETEIKKTVETKDINKLTSPYSMSLKKNEEKK